MPISLFHTVVSWILKKRKYQIDLFVKHPIEVQEEVLYDLLSEARETSIGREYDFGSIRSYEVFAERVPIRQYESIEPLIERNRRGEQNVFWPGRIQWFAKSSGTTNAKSKFIPVSDEALDDCHFKAGRST